MARTRTITRFYTPAAKLRLPRTLLGGELVFDLWLRLPRALFGGVSDYAYGYDCLDGTPDCALCWEYSWGASRTVS